MVVVAIPPPQKLKESTHGNIIPMGASWAEKRIKVGGMCSLLWVVRAVGGICNNSANPSASMDLYEACKRAVAKTDIM